MFIIRKPGELTVITSESLPAADGATIVSFATILGEVDLSDTPE